jgi:hypothetical protein
MSKKELYIANQNGDWWMITPESVLYVLRPDEIPTDSSDGDDKFEDVIMENGTEITGFFDDIVKVLSE